MKRISLLLFVVVSNILCSVTPARSQNYKVETLYQSGPSRNRIDLVLLGDGYTTSDADQSKMTTDAKAIMDGLFAISPYKEYKQLFNVWLIHVTSPEAGVTNDPNKGDKKNTTLKSAFWSHDTERLMTADTVATTKIAAALKPEYDQLIVFGNSTKYGGAAGSIVVMSVNPKSGPVFAHELGHALAGLADEYETPYPGYPKCPNSPGDCRQPNITNRSKKEEIKWNYFIDNTTQVPTAKTAANAQLVGAFEGGRYLSTGLYRPKLESCKMRSVSNDFCPVCLEQMIISFWRRVRPIDSVTPAPKGQEAIQVTSCTTPLTFKVTPVSTTTPALETRWVLDDNWVGGDTTYTWDPRSTTAGDHALWVMVYDTNQNVKKDPGISNPNVAVSPGLLRDLRGWYIKNLNCMPPTPTAAAQTSTNASTGLPPVDLTDFTGTPPPG